jgi:hypothetical protein
MRLGSDEVFGEREGNGVGDEVGKRVDMRFG